MAASSARTSGLPNRFRTFWESKASRLVMHFCNRSIRRRFCPAVRIGALGLGGGTERRAMWFGADAVQVMSENPYRLARDIRGIGFKTADAIAMKLGGDKTATTRPRAGISYALTEA